MRVSLLCASLLFVVSLAGGKASEEPSSPGATRGRSRGKSPGESMAPVPLNPQRTVLLDRAGKRVLLKAKVCARDRILEMLCCLARTKEHESILALDAKAAVVHAALLAIGARQGTAVRHYKEVAPGKIVPDFKPPTGQRIAVFLQWKNKKGVPRRVRAQKWVRRATGRYFSAPLAQLPDSVVLPKEPELVFDKKNKELVFFGTMTASQRDVLQKLSSDAAYRKAVSAIHTASQPTEMRAHWVFAGSGFVVNMQTKKRVYLAENGNVICVANFPSALLDVAQQSSDKGSNLLYEAYSDRIPPVGTDVLIELIPEEDPVGKDVPPPPPAPRNLER